MVAFSSFAGTAIWRSRLGILKRNTLRPCNLSGPAICTPAFRRFARIDSCESIRKKKPIFEALGQIRANRVLSPIRIQIRVIRVQCSLLSISGGSDSQNKGFSKRESIRANRSTKLAIKNMHHRVTMTTVLNTMTWKSRTFRKVT